MNIRESLVLSNSKSGIVIITSLAGKLRLLVLLVAVVLFFLSLSSEIAYKTEFRLLVVVVAFGLIALVGPRQEIFLIRDEQRVKITRRFFVFSKTSEHAMQAVQLTISDRVITLHVETRSYLIRVSGKDSGPQELFEKMNELIQESQR